MSASGTSRRFDAQIRRILFPLLSLPTGPFHEEKIAAFIIGQCRRLGLDCEVDVHGNVLAQYRFGRAAGSIWWMAHMDHPALEIVARRDRSAVHARMLGGVLPRHLRGAPLRVIGANGEETRARVVAVPRASWARDRLVRLDAASDAAPGSLVVFDLPGFRRTGTRIHSRQCDDLAGVGAVLIALEELVRRKTRAEAWGVFTRAEEAGFIGATGLAQSELLPRDQPLISVECSAERPGARLGRGFVIRAGDAVTTFDPSWGHALTRLARSIAAKDPSFRYQRALMDGGACEASPLTAFGYRAAAVCLPLGGYHNMGSGGRLVAETIHAADLASLVTFIFETSRRRRELDRALPELRRRYERHARTSAARFRPRP